MKPAPINAPWSEDQFWKEVVAVLTGGKKLRGEHYLQRLSADALEQLRSALSFAGTLKEQQALCPVRVGGETDGSLPNLCALSEISQAMRQVNVLRALQRQDLIGATTKARCGELGLDPQLTNAVIRVVGEEALRQQAENQVGNFAISAANVLVMTEGMRNKAKLEEAKLVLKKESQQTQKFKATLDERRLKLLEKKSEAYDRAQAALTAAKTSKGGITKETLARIEQELNLM